MIIMEGRLVDIEARNDHEKRWIDTSLTRTDSGAGACEVLYVEKLILKGQTYQ